jgi:hypothetical protein
VKKLLVVAFASLALFALTSPAYSADTQVGKKCQVFSSQNNMKHVHVCAAVYKHAGQYSYAETQIWSLPGERPASWSAIFVQYWSSQHGTPPWCDNGIHTGCQGNLGQQRNPGQWSPGTSASFPYILDTSSATPSDTYCNVHAQVIVIFYWPAGGQTGVNMNSFDGNVAPICVP